MKDTCRGCACNGDCIIQYHGSVAIRDCPCRVCIVKLMCDSGCDIYHNYFSVFYLNYSKIR
jgi:hypothetical protein